MNSQQLSDLVGTNKRFLIEDNNADLRIIGNGNRIRIIKNTGNLQIIGNDARLLIENNAGILKFTGNDGRISLGSESSYQLVDYTGNNGLMKIVDTQDLGARARQQTNATTSTGSCTKADIFEDEDGFFNDPPPPYTSTPQAVNIAATDPPPSYASSQLPNIADLRFFGNNNRVRITHNPGKLEIIGNCNRLMINNNAGPVKYTGNDGRICLGKESSIQHVDYTGRNGKVKIANDQELDSILSKNKLHG